MKTKALSALSRDIKNAVDFERIFRLNAGDEQFERAAATRILRPSLPSLNGTLGAARVVRL